MENDGASCPVSGTGAPSAFWGFENNSMMQFNRKMGIGMIPKPDLFAPTDRHWRRLAAAKNPTAISIAAAPKAAVGTKDILDERVKAAASRR
ncbi:hypothetical protein ACU5AY_19070 [Rhizobium sp. PAMB 3174]